MKFKDPNDWLDNVRFLPSATATTAALQRKAFDALTAEVHAARARELTENLPSPPTSEDLLCRLMATPAANADQLSIKLRLFAVELAKEAEFGQNPDFRLMGYFASIHRDCVALLKTQPPESDEAGS